MSEQIKISNGRDSKDRPFTQITLFGEFVSDNTITELQDAIFLSLKKNNHILLDMHGVKIFASQAIGVVVQCHHAAKKQNGMLCMLRPQGWVEKYIRMARIDTLVPIYDDIKIACDNF